ncbi:unnamed protein product, partial [Ectocarpus sp. 12 AP-2014]
ATFRSCQGSSEPLLNLESMPPKVNRVQRWFGFLSAYTYLHVAIPTQGRNTERNANMMSIKITAARSSASCFSNDGGDSNARPPPGAAASQSPHVRRRTLSGERCSRPPSGRASRSCPPRAPPRSHDAWQQQEQPPARPSADRSAFMRST